MAASTSVPVIAPRRVTRWFSATTWGAVRWQRGLTAALVAVFFWPEASVDPTVGIDPSWQAGLALARTQHLAWGPEIVFTYGPLGFLQTTSYYSFNQSLAATVYQPIVVATLFLGIAAVLRLRHAPTTSLIGAFITTVIVATLHIGHGWGVPGLEYPELAVLAAFVWGAVPLLQHDSTRPTVFTTCIVLGAVAGLQLLVKFNSGLTIVAIALAVSVLLDWRAVRRHSITVAAFAVAVLIGWVLAGQRPGDLRAWLRSSVAVVSGYSEAMAYPLSPAAVLIFAWIVVLCVMFVRGRPGIPRSFVALAGLTTVVLAKRALLGFSEWHIYPLAGLAVVVVVIAPFSRTWRRTLAVIVGVIVVAALGAETAFLFASGDHVHGHTAAAMRAPVQGADRLVTLTRPAHLSQRIDHAKARQRALYAIPDRFIESIGSATVHIDNYETSAAWAYDLAWRPVPVFQSYAAYTPALDELNSESLTSGPQFIVSRLSPASPATYFVDGRLGVQESPRYSRALLCNYVVRAVEDRWALFTHTGPHCGPLTALGQVSVGGDDVITVPAPSGPDMAVLVGIDLEPTILDRLLKGTVAPLTVPTVVLDGVAYRLVAANAAEPFLVTTPAAVHSTNLQIHTDTIGVGSVPSRRQGKIGARLRFYEMRVEP